MAKGVGVLIDLTKCMGCRACQVSCKRWHNLPAEDTEFSPEWTNPHHLSKDTWTLIKFAETERDGEFLWRFVKIQCMHCIDAPCVAVCPTKALHATEKGYVLYDEKLCIGCRYCIQACPFDVPKFDWERNRVVQKCTFCFERVETGLEPACVKTCPAGALEFFEDYVELLRKVEEIKAKRSPVFVYGDKEVGGLRWVYVSDVPFEKLGFPLYIPERYGDAGLGMLGQFGLVGVVAGAVMYSLHLYSKRRAEAKKAEELKKEGG